MTTEHDITRPRTTLGCDAQTPVGDVGSGQRSVADTVANETTETRLNPIASQPAASGEPEDTAALFSRMGLSVDLDEEADTAEETCDDVATATGESSDATNADAEDAEVAEYMNRLLGRPTTSGASQSSPPAGGAATDRSPTEYSPASTDSSAERTAVPSSATAAPADKSNTSDDRTPRLWRKPRPATPPESQFDLMAMRELANLSAHGALDTHSRKQLVQVTFTKLILAVLAVATGMVMVWYADSLRPYTWMGASVCWTIAVVWGAQYLCLVRACYGHGNRGKKHPSRCGDVNNPESASENTPAATASSD